MIIEPEKYFQYTIPKLHTLWNGKIRDFSHQAIAGYQHFISAYQDKKLVVLISDSTRDKLQTYYDSMTKQKSNVPLMELSHTGRWYANGFISAYNFCEQYEKEHPSANMRRNIHQPRWILPFMLIILNKQMKCNHLQIMNSTRTTSSILDE